MILSLSGIFSGVVKVSKAAYPWVSSILANRKLRKKLHLGKVGTNGHYAYFSIVNPIKRAITISSCKIKFDQVDVPCLCIHKENSSLMNNWGFRRSACLDIVPPNGR